MVDSPSDVSGTEVGNFALGTADGIPNGECGAASRRSIPGTVEVIASGPVSRSVSLTVGDSGLVSDGQYRLDRLPVGEYRVMCEGLAWKRCAVMWLFRYGKGWLRRLRLYDLTAFNQRQTDLAAAALHRALERHRADPQRRWFIPAPHLPVQANFNDRSTYDEMEVAGPLLQLATQLRDSQLTEIATAILQQQQDSHWRTTRATADVLLGLTAYYQAQLQTTPSPGEVLVFNGTTGSLIGHWQPGAGNLRQATVLRERPLRAGNPVQAGERLLAQLTVGAKQDSHHVMIEERLPSGAEVTSQDLRLLTGSPPEYWWNWFWTHPKNRDDRVAFFSTFLKKGRHEFVYFFRPEICSQFQASPAFVEEMYNPSRYGRSTSHLLRIIP
ncbi:MAG: alpha-2-macroglobulin family protein [Cyanobacteriota bacterium]